MTVTDILAQIESETGVDVADMMVVPQPGARRVLREITDGNHKLYVVTDTLTCLRCGHNWEPRADQPPKFCPRCNSPYWNKPRQNKSNSPPEVAQQHPE